MRGPRLFGTLRGVELALECPIQIALAQMKRVALKMSSTMVMWTSLYNFT